MSSDAPLHTKIEAWYHLTRKLSYPLMIVLSVLMLPAMIIRFYQGWFQMLFIDLPLFMASTFSISSFYLVSQRELFPKSWPRALLYLPFLMALGIGLTITNTKAVIEALIGKESAFARTPKYHVESKKDKVRATKYRKRLGWVPWLELVIGTYFAMTVYYADTKRKLRYDSIPCVVRGGLLVHGTDVAAAGAFLRRGVEWGSSHQTVSGWSVALECPHHAFFYLRFLSLDLWFTIHSPKVSHRARHAGSTSHVTSQSSKEDPMLRLGQLFSLLGLVLLAISLLSCGPHDSSEYFVFVAANLQVPYWQAAGAGFTKAGSQFKVRTDFLGPNTYDPKAERDALDQAVQQKATGILLGVTDPVLLKDSIDKAIAAGVPVITMDSDAPASKRLFFIGTNNYEVGMTGGLRLAQELKGKGNVVVFTMPDQHNMQDRLHGYRDALERTPNIKITRVVDIQGDPRIAFDTTTQIIGKEKDQVDAFVCLEAQSGKEVAGVLNSYHVTGKVVMAMDTDPETLQYIQSGAIAATISQKPYTMAFVGMQMLDNLYHHRPSSLETDWSKDSFAPIPAFVDTGSALIDKSNVDSFLQAKQSATGKQK